MVLVCMGSLSDFLPRPKQDPLKWSTDSDGRAVMPEKQSQFLDWLLSDLRKPETEKEWAAENDISSETLKKWKQNRKFREEWERRALDRNISVETTQDVMRTLKKAAQRGDVTAAKFYMQWVERLMPPKQVDRDDTIAHLSDEELEAEMRQLLDEESLVG